MKKLKKLFTFGACCCAFVYITINTKAEPLKLESTDNVITDIKKSILNQPNDSIVAPFDSNKK